MKGFTVKRLAYISAREISEIKLTPSYCLLIQIPFLTQTDMHQRSRMIKRVKQNINIILLEISMILYLLALGMAQLKTEKS